MPILNRVYKDIENKAYGGARDGSLEEFTGIVQNERGVIVCDLALERIFEQRNVLLGGRIASMQWDSTLSLGIFLGP